MRIDVAALAKAFLLGAVVFALCLFSFKMNDWFIRRHAKTDAIIERLNILESKMEGLAAVQLLAPTSAVSVIWKSNINSRSYPIGYIE